MNPNQTPEEILAESLAAEAINATANAQQAIEKSRASQINAALSNDKFTKDMFAQIEQSIATSIQANVNGKIDSLKDQIAKNTIKMDDIKTENNLQTVIIDEMRSNLNGSDIRYKASMVRIEPALLAFEQGQRDLATARRGGKAVLWLSAAITAIGGAILILKNLFHW